MAAVWECSFGLTKCYSGLEIANLRIRCWKTGLDPLEDKLITIQYRRNMQNHIFKIWNYDSEKEFIVAFLNDWMNIPHHLLRGGDYFVTFNFRLDWPFLFSRCLFNKLNEDPVWHKQLWNILFHGPDFIDVDQLLETNSPLRRVETKIRSQTERIQEFGNFSSLQITALQRHWRVCERWIERTGNDIWCDLKRAILRRTWKTTESNSLMGFSILSN